MSQMQFYEVRQEVLTFFVRHYWSVTTRCEISPSLLLPMDHVDLILAPSETFAYYLEDKVISPQGIHFHGLRRKSIGVLARQETRIWGISFKPWGFQPIAGAAMNAFADRIVLMEELHPELAQKLDKGSANWDTDAGFLDELETILASALNASNILYLDQLC